MANSLTTLGDWTVGRSTYYEGIDDGACGYGNISGSSFPYRHIGAANQAYFNNASACGQCFELKCIEGWNVSGSCCNADTTVIIEITDECPVDGNEKWCSGDIVHFDLSPKAFATIGVQTCGVIKTNYRRVACDFGTDIKIKNKDGINQWWYALYVENVDNYGSLSEVQLKDSSSGATWVTGTHTSYNAYIFQSGSGWQTPISLAITDSDGNTLTATNVVTDLTEYSIFDFGSNFAIATSNSSATTSTTSASATSTTSTSATTGSATTSATTASATTTSATTSTGTTSSSQKITSDAHGIECFYVIYIISWMLYVLL